MKSPKHLLPSKHRRIDNTKVLEGKAFDFAELERVDRGIVPQAAVDEVNVVDHDGEDDG
ncbi:uncharacterized protein BJ212DRAFT_1376792 [Suillus subaureus]|uniref:Uncharacterized protein n=1 Tax=Suillus subaureus TaxID=48587 RepID=A0A9P7JAF6_9AGAM|nr:uncharacterized protein BJ212DRAFT_1376792 [Suillus subaureus]KAG1810921.1 hypothetical protein BJ212DRAFT_1376792 [Suillus subaureus]